MTPELTAASEKQIAREQSGFTAALSSVLEQFLAVQRGILTDVSPDAPELVDAIDRLTRGGKRLRPVLAYWGWRGAGGEPDSSPIVRAGAALELFQAAALIHDDIIDRSETRRGAPSVHRRFAGRHSESGWTLDGDRFGEAAGILAGDLCLAYSEELFTMVGSAAGWNTPARAVFNLMRTEVMAGQYLDVLEEVAGSSRGRSGAGQRARNVLRYKSAKYSSERPLMLGGALAGADPELLAAYSAFALPLGEAFQIRDDVLGVFGDPALTGKPAGDDLREGKRTVLIGHALESGTETQISVLEGRLGRPDLNEDDVTLLREVLVSAGALDAAEADIEALSAEASAALELLPVNGVVRAALAAVARSAIERTA